LVTVVVYPGPRGDGADAEPDEAGGTAEHPVVIALDMVVPVHVVVWHMTMKKVRGEVSREMLSFDTTRMMDFYRILRRCGVWKRHPPRMPGRQVAQVC
jgi:hypothetical protein